jgi:hypothetical protein
MGVAERQAAERIAQRARIHEPEITRILTAIAASQKAAELADLGTRLKKLDRIEEKILDGLDEKGSLEAAESEFFDALRYTLVVADDYRSTFFAVVDSLRSRGIALVRSKNSWDHDGYQAINAVFRAPDGTPFEVQFHTPESRACRNAAHGLYEQIRDPATDPLELDHLLEQTIATWRPVCRQAPPNSVQIPNLP